MLLSLREAAAAAGKSKPTVLRAITAGKLSANRDAHGQWRIDPAELGRVYPAQAPAPEPIRESDMLRREISRLEDEVRDLRRRLDASEDRRDAGDVERRQLQAQLTALLERPRRRWWRVR